MPAPTFDLQSHSTRSDGALEPADVVAAAADPAIATRLAGTAQVVNPGLEKRMLDDPRLGDKFLGGIPSGRLGQPEDIQGLTVFLASDASSWITGALIPMDGGNLAMNAGATIGSPVADGRPAPRMRRKKADRRRR